MIERPWWIFFFSPSLGVPQQSVGSLSPQKNKTKQQICLAAHALLQLLLQCHYKIFIHGKSLWFQPVAWLRAPGWSQHVIQTGALAADLSCTTPLSAPSQQTPGEEQRFGRTYSLIVFGGKSKEGRMSSPSSTGEFWPPSFFVFLTN